MKELKLLVKGKYNVTHAAEGAGVHRIVIALLKKAEQTGVFELIVAQKGGVEGAEQSGVKPVCIQDQSSIEIHVSTADVHDRFKCYLTGKKKNLKEVLESLRKVSTDKGWFFLESGVKLVPFKQKPRDENNIHKSVFTDTECLELFLDVLASQTEKGVVTLLQFTKVFDQEKLQPATEKGIQHELNYLIGNGYLQIHEREPELKCAFTKKTADLLKRNSLVQQPRQIVSDINPLIEALEAQARQYETALLKTDSLHKEITKAHEGINNLEMEINSSLLLKSRMELELALTLVELSNNEAIISNMENKTARERYTKIIELLSPMLVPA